MPYPYRSARDEAEWCATTSILPSSGNGTHPGWMRTNTDALGVLSLDDVLEVLAIDLQNIAGSVRHERQIEGSLRP